MSDLDPAQSGPSPASRHRGGGNPPDDHMPDVSGRINWDEYTHYECCICHDGCINEVGSVYARARECRHCYVVPVLVRHSVEDPSSER